MGQTHFLTLWYVIHQLLVSVTDCFCSPKQITRKEREVIFILYLRSARCFLWANLFYFILHNATV